MRISRVSGRMDPRVRPDRFHSTDGQARPETRGWTGRSILRPTICGWYRPGAAAGGRRSRGAQVPQTVSGERLKHREQIEQQATDVARQLVGEVLDVQLQQFRDNNLTSHPWYAEIRSMRDHLDALVSRQMKEVVEILAKSDLGDNAQRVKAYAAARSKSREILVRIEVEEQILLRRLKIAELARQIQQLIEHQTKVRKDTEAIPGEAAERRPELNLSALEDQRDVTASFGQFKKNLAQASRFSGPVGREAAAAAKLIENEQIDQWLGKAESGLHGGEFTAAAASQQQVISGLEALLEKIRNLQKSMDANSLERQIAEALKKQEEIREESAKKPLESAAADKLAAEQDALAKKIDELSAAAKPEVRRTTGAGQASGRRGRRQPLGAETARGPRPRRQGRAGTEGGGPRSGKVRRRSQPAPIR